MIAAMRELDDIYRQPNGASPLSELVERLAAATPHDRAMADLSSYRGVVAPWNDWAHLAERGRHWSVVLARLCLER